MRTLFRIIALILSGQQLQPQEAPQVYYHVHPTTLFINGKEVKTVDQSKRNFTIASLTKSEFVSYYKKSKNIICL